MRTGELMAEMGVSRAEAERWMETCGVPRSRDRWGSQWEDAAAERAMKLAMDARTTEVRAMGRRKRGAPHGVLDGQAHGA